MRKYLLPVVVSLALSSGAALAQQTDRQICDSDDDAAAILACTRIIDAGALRGRELSKIYFNRGLSLRRQGETRRAVADYDRAIALDPDDAANYNNRGIALDDLEEHERAIADYTKAIAIDPKHARAYFNRAGTYDNTGRQAEAIRDYDRAIAVDPKYAAAYNNRGLIFEKQGNPERALADYTRAVEADADYHRGYNNRGDTHAALGDYDRAIADYNEAIAIDSENATYHRSLGLVRFYKGEYKSAIADFRQALELRNDAYAMIFLFLSRMRLGEDARSELLANAGKLKNKDWPYAAIELLSGTGDVQGELPAADRPNEVCEANFYTGHLKLLQSDKAAGRRYFELAEQSCPKTIFEYAAAKAELKRIRD